MKSFNKLFIIVASLFILCFVSVLVYVSLLGENNNANATVQQFFDQIRSKDYFSVCSNSVFMSTTNPFKTEGSCAENSFLFELALLKHFNLTASSKYKILIKRNHLWIPFISNESIKASLSLAAVDEGSNPLSFFKKDSKPIYIEDLFTIQYENGIWKIVDIDIQNPKIYPVFKQLKKELELSDCITKIGNKYLIKKIEIDASNLDDIQKRKYEFISLYIRRIIMDEDL